MAGQPETGVGSPQRSLPLAEIAEHVLRSLPLGVAAFDRQLRIVHRNEAAEKLFAAGGTVAEILAAGTRTGQYQDWESELRRVLETGTPLRHDGVLFCPDANTELLLNLACTPLTQGPNAEVIGAVLAAEDITTRASLEKRLAVSERLAAVGKLAARVAHELNNPLDGIMRYINLSIRLLESRQPARVVGYLDESRKGLMRMIQIISELLEFSRSTHTRFDELNINRTVEEAIRTMQENADRAGVTITAVFREGQMPSLRGGMLYQVCCNLVKNAIDAMPHGGRLTITTARADRDVVLCFEDTGVGLPEHIDEIFEPFFTTKKPGEGTGLGLAICKDYVERLHGRIVAGRGDPTGAVLTVYIPLASCIPPTTGSPSP